MCKEAQSLAPIAGQQAKPQTKGSALSSASQPREKAGMRRKSLQTQHAVITGQGSERPTEKETSEAAGGLRVWTSYQGPREHGSLTLWRDSFQRHGQGFGTRRPLLPQTGAAPLEGCCGRRGCCAPSSHSRLLPEPESACAGTDRGQRHQCGPMEHDPSAGVITAVSSPGARGGHGLYQDEHEKQAESSSWETGWGEGRRAGHCHNQLAERVWSPSCARVTVTRMKAI